MPTARKLPSGSWRCLVYAGKDENGKRKYESFTADSKPKAEKLAADWQLSRSARPEDRTVREVIEAYIDHSAAVLSPATVLKYRSMLSVHYGPIADVSVRRLTSDQVQAYISQLSLARSPKTVSCVYSLLTAALAQAAPDLTLHVRLPRRVPHEIEIPSPEDVARMIESASDDFKPVLIIASTMGLRRGEISALTWSDVRDGLLWITKAYTLESKSSNYILHAPKTNAGIRAVPIPPAAVPCLTQPDDADPDARIIPFHPNIITKRFDRLMHRLNMPYHFHSLRHYYDSVLLSLGVPDKYIMARMGHATTSMTKQVYQHIMKAKDAEITDSINQFFK